MEKRQLDKFEKSRLSSIQTEKMTTTIHWRSATGNKDVVEKEHSLHKMQATKTLINKIGGSTEEIPRVNAHVFPITREKHFV